jgi:PKD repeat protein
MSCSAPQQTAAGVVALAYTVGGYVAYQSTTKDSAYVVIRVPEMSYQSVLAQVETMGNVSSLVSNSNDVSIQYTNFNATLASLLTEQSALLRLLNQSTTINSTLAIENQLQSVDQQINDVQSQILQTKTLIDFATIDVTISKNVETIPLSMTLTATPANGTAPFSVTFSAIVKGGVQPYVVNYNFGDGTAAQGQILIHTYYTSGNYKVTVTATDQNGTVATRSATIHVVAPPNQYGVANFPTMIANLFVNVVEGIAEVAVVVLPLAAVGAVVVIPLRHRSRAQKNIKQGQ